MEIVRFFRKYLFSLSSKTPAILSGVFLIIVLFVLRCPVVSAWTGEVWPDKPHPAVDYLSFAFGGGYSYFMPSGYNGLRNVEAGTFIMDAELYASREIPFFSKLKWQSSENFKLSEEPVIAGSNNPSRYYGFIELRLPFTTVFLSHNTSWFMQYEKQGGTFNGEFSSETYYGNGSTFQSGEKVILGKQLQKIAIAIDTPITGEDSHDSYSRFGFYYVQDIRPRSARRPNEIVAEGWLLKVLERHGGFFYDINKPVFTNGLILQFYLGAGFGQQGILRNIYDMTDSEFKASKTLFFTEVNAGVAYRIKVTEWMDIKARLKYSYFDINSLNSVSSNVSKLENDAEQIVQTGLTFCIIL